MAQRSTLPEGITQPTVDELTLEAMIQAYGLPSLRDTYFRHFGVESSGGRADTSNATVGASGQRGGRGPMQVIGTTFEGLRNQNYIPKGYSWENPVHSTQAGLALYNELRGRYDTTDPDTLSALYYAGNEAVSRDKKGNLKINRDYKPPNNSITVGQYLDRMAAQKVPEPFPAEQVASRRQQLQDYLKHSIGVPYDYSLTDKVAAQNTPSNPRAMTHQTTPRSDDELNMFRTGVEERFKAAMARGDRKHAAFIKQRAMEYAQQRGWLGTEQETENGN